MNSDIDKSVKAVKRLKNPGGKNAMKSKLRAKQQMKITAKSQRRKPSKRKDPEMALSGQNSSDNTSTLPVFQTNLVPVSSCDKEDSNTELEGTACPTCGVFFNMTELAKHSGGCLSTKVARTTKKLPKKTPDRKTVRNEPFLCPNCNVNLSRHGTDQRNTHINRCIDQSMKKSKVPKKTKSCRCPLCLKIYCTKSYCNKHLISCRERRTLACTTALALRHLDSNDHASAEPQAPSASESCGENRLQPKKMLITKSKVKNSPDEDVLQLAVAVSKKKNLKKRRRKGSKEVSFMPLMITVDPNSEKLQTQLHSIERSNESSGNGDIPSDHAVAAMALRLPSCNAPSQLHERDFSVGQAYCEDDRPGPSGLNSQNHLRNVQNSDCVPPSTIIASAQAVNAGNVPGQSEVQTNGPTNSNQRSSLSSPSVSHNDELQSPEVSSSDMKNIPMTTDCDERQSTNKHETFISQRRESKMQWNDTVASEQFSPATENCWSASSYSGLNRSPYRTRKSLYGPNLRLMPQSDVDGTAGQHTGYANENYSTDSVQQAAETESLDEVDSHDIIVGDDRDSFHGTSSSTQFVASFTKLIDNPEFSDAEILAGKLKESIKLHRSILFCCCPKLLEETAGSKNNVLRLCNYTKSEIMPMIDYIYSSSVQSLVTAARSDKEAFSRTAQLLKRFSVSIDDEDQQLLDAELGMLKEATPGMHSSNDVLEKSIGSDHGIEQNRVDNSIAFAEHEEVQPSTEDEISSHDVLASEDLHQLNLPSAFSMPPDCFSASTEPLAGVEENAPTDSGLSSSEPPVSPYQKDSRSSNISDASLSSNKLGKHKRLAKGRPVAQKRDKLRLSSAKAIKRGRRSAHYMVARKSRRMSSGTRRHEWRRPSCPCCVDKVHISEVLPRFKQRIAQDRFKASTSSRRQNRDSTKVTPVKNSLTLKASTKEQMNTKAFAGMSRSSPYKRRRFSGSLEPLKKASKQSKRASKTTGINKVLRSTKTNDEVSITQGSLPESSPSPHLKTTASHGTASDVEIKTSVMEARRKSAPLSKSRTSKEMIYISERLPRFKEREHIKSRPGVAIMGKAIHKASRIRSKSATVRKTNSVPEAFKVKSHAKKVFETPQAMPKVNFEQGKQSQERRYLVKKLQLSDYAFSNRSHSPDDAQKCEPDPSSVLGESDISGNDSEAEIFDDLSLHDCDQERCCNISCGLSSQKMSQSEHISSINFQNKKSAPLKLEILSHGANVYLPVAEYPVEVCKQATKVLVRVKPETNGGGNQFSELREALNSEENVQEDDLCINTAEVNSVMLHLSRFSASPSIHSAARNIYSFGKISREEVLELSAKVVDSMHTDGTLLVALRESMRKTGSIKRGSLQDRRRCWDSVTPGTASYDPKLNAILCLPEEYQTAITDPLVACVVKHYLCYKKYQFDCLPIVCDRMEKLYQMEKRTC